MHVHPFPSLVSPPSEVLTRLHNNSSFRFIYDLTTPPLTFSGRYVLIINGCRLCNWRRLAGEMETKRVVVEQVWELLAISSIDSKSVRYKIPGAFFL